MRSAPALVYPVRRSGGQAALLWALVALTTAALGGWIWQSTALGERHVLAVLLAVGTAGLSWYRWWRAPTGDLAWTGGHWLWQPLAGPNIELLHVGAALDLQWLMLLEVRSVTGPVRWLWVQRDAAPARWLALRRAVFAEVPVEPSPPGQPVDPVTMHR